MTAHTRSQHSQPADWLAAWRRQARAEGLDLSTWIGACCNANLPADVVAGLSKRNTAGNPDFRRQIDES